MLPMFCVERLSKYDLKQIQRQKLSEAMENGLKVAVDCSFEETLSSKVYITITIIQYTYVHTTGVFAICTYR